MYVSESKEPYLLGFLCEAHAPGSAVVATSTLSSPGFELRRRLSMRLKDACFNHPATEAGELRVQDWNSGIKHAE